MACKINKINKIKNNQFLQLYKFTFIFIVKTACSIYKKQPWKPRYQLSTYFPFVENIKRDLFWIEKDNAYQKTLLEKILYPPKCL